MGDNFTKIEKSFQAHADKLLDDYLSSEWGECPECGAELSGRGDKWENSQWCETEDCEYESGYEADFEEEIESRYERYGFVTESL